MRSKKYISKDIFDKYEDHIIYGSLLLVYNSRKRNGRNTFIAHCMSKDLAMGAGVAKILDREFALRDKLTRDRYAEDYAYVRSRIDTDKCLLVDNVLNLVTKERYWHKPTLKSLEESIDSMIEIIKKENITDIIMPMIGCGLDRLDPDDVFVLIDKKLTPIENLTWRVILLSNEYKVVDNDVIGGY